MDEITIKVTQQELGLIGDALAELPYKISRQLIEKLSQQFAAHQNAVINTPKEG